VYLCNKPARAVIVDQTHTSPELAVGIERIVRMVNWPEPGTGVIGNDIVGADQKITIPDHRIRYFSLM